MTTLQLKSNLAGKALACAAQILGEHSMKTGRYWYKDQQICDYVILKGPETTQIQTSGGVRFSMLLRSPVRTEDEPSGHVTLLGWLKESPNALRIVMSILQQQSKIVARRREERRQRCEFLEQKGLTPPLLCEALGTHFSIKMSDAQLDPRDRIDQDTSDANFELALRLHWYHQAFVSICKKLGVKCYYRSALAYRKAEGEGDGEGEVDGGPGPFADQPDRGLPSLTLSLS